MYTTGDYVEYRCTACRKGISKQVVECKKCPKLFYHPGCASKHKIFINRELVQCLGPFKQFNAEEEDTGLTGSAGGSKGTTPGVDDTKIDWLIKTVKAMKDEIACKNEVKKMIQEIVDAEMRGVKAEIEGLRKIIQGGIRGPASEEKRTYSEITKDKKKEKVIIIKPKEQQESEVTKKAIKEKIDIKNMSVGVTRMKKGSKGTVILGCETTEEVEQLKAVVQEKMGKSVQVTESAQQKPKIKIVNMEEEELELADEELIETIKKQNAMEDIEGREMKIVKRINKQGRHEGSVIMIVDEGTHQELLDKGRISVGWKKCPVYNHISVKRCYKCWGYYHIAKNCTKEETCHKCAGNHESNKCQAKKNKCVNCTSKNQTYNLQLNTEHDAFDRECPTYKRAMQEEKRRAGWQESTTEGRNALVHK